MLSRQAPADITLANNDSRTGPCGEQSVERAESESAGAAMHAIQ
jgi:hypothetical protein